VCSSDLDEQAFIDEWTSVADKTPLRNYTTLNNTNLSNITKVRNVTHPPFGFFSTMSRLTSPLIVAIVMTVLAFAWMIGLIVWLCIVRN
jgi:hypothetical protein